MKYNTSRPRNKNIANVFYLAGFIESWGRGFDKVRKGFADKGAAYANDRNEIRRFDGHHSAPNRKQSSCTSSSTSNSTSNSTSERPIPEQVMRLLVVLEGEMSVREIMVALGLNSRPMFIANYLNPATSAGLVEMTQPDSPKSPTQKYRLTEVGKALVKK